MESPQNNEPDLTRLGNEIEALLFASDAPIAAGRLASMTGVSSVRTVKDCVESLEKFYRENGRSFGIVEVAGGYQLTTLPEYAGTVASLFRNKRKSRLSQAALETLAIIAYKQPISRLMIETIRGVNCDGVIATLSERELITITGRGDGIGKPYLYSTTSRFLEYLGLKDYRDLPDMAELEKSLENLELIPRPSKDYELPADFDDGPAPRRTDEAHDGENPAAGTAEAASPAPEDTGAADDEGRDMIRHEFTNEDQ